MANKQMVLFSGQVIEATVTHKANEVNEWVQNIRSLYNSGSIAVGLHCEWKLINVLCMNKIATLQLCVGNKCLVLQLFYIDYIPQSLKSFLTDPNFTFVGYEVENDVSKLRNEYGLFCTKTVDIQPWSMACSPDFFYQKPSLETFAEVVWHIWEKPIRVWLSNWENRVLSKEQIAFACIDAYASYRIGCKLVNE